MPDEGESMANEFMYDASAGYQSTQAYASSSRERRRQLNRYKKECNVSDEHMYLLLYKQDLEMVPPEARKQGDTATYAMVVVGFLLLWSSLQAAMNSQGGANVPLIFLSVGSFALVAVVYYTGMLNPYKRAVKNLDKRLKEMPDVPDFYEWSAQHPSKEERKAGKRRK